MCLGVERSGSSTEGTLHHQAGRPSPRPNIEMLSETLTINSTKRLLHKHYSHKLYFMDRNQATELVTELVTKLGQQRTVKSSGLEDVTERWCGAEYACLVLSLLVYKPRY